MSIDIDWKYECAIGRLPIFCMGIISFHEGSDNCRKSMRFALASMLLAFVAVFIYMGGGSNIHTFYLLYLIFPVVFYALCYALSKITIEKLRRSIEYLGKNSLEIYAGNVIAMSICPIIIPISNKFVHVVLYMLMTVFASAICIFYNRFVQSWIKRNI